MASSGSSFAQSQAGICRFLNATMSLGVLPPFGTRSVDAVGEIRLSCDNRSDRPRSIRIAIQFLGSEFDRPRPRATLGPEGLGVRLYADAAHTEEIAIGGGSARLLQKSIQLAPLQQIEVIVPVYARVSPEPEIAAGHYFITLPLVISVD